jgi:hypothetical protein
MKFNVKKEIEEEKTLPVEGLKKVNKHIQFKKCKTEGSAHRLEQM